jgi:thioredoxin-dependent peroxiredoxin
MLISLAVIVLAVGWLARARRATLQPGDKAPGFALPDQNGKTVRLDDYLGHKTVVLAFYIKAFTPGWRSELRAYQADIARFERLGAQVIGISVDSREKNAKFARELGVKFPILSDEQKTVSRAYQVLMPVIRLASRTTFVIDRSGTIQHIDRGGAAIDPSGALQVCTVPRISRPWSKTRVKRSVAAVAFDEPDGRCSPPRPARRAPAGPPAQTW